MAYSVLQGKRKLIKNPECIKYILCSEKVQGKILFQVKRNLLKNPEYKKYIQYSEKFQGTLCFSGQAQFAQKSWM